MDTPNTTNTTSRLHRLLAIAVLLVAAEMAVVVLTFEEPAGRTPAASPQNPTEATAPAAFAATPRF